MVEFFKEPESEKLVVNSQQTENNYQEYEQNRNLKNQHDELIRRLNNLEDVETKPEGR